MFDFECAKGHKHEALVRPDARTVACPKCNKVATRLLAAPRCRLEGTTGSFPSASMAWEKRRESHMRKEQKHKDSHGTWAENYK
jgi:hypothetical protein